MDTGRETVAASLKKRSLASEENHQYLISYLPSIHSSNWEVTFKLLNVTLYVEWVTLSAVESRQLSQPFTENPLHNVEHPGV